MGKSTRKKQAQLELREKNELKYLAQHHVKKVPRGVVTACTAGVSTSKINKLSSHYIRDFRSWVFTGKSKKPEVQRLSLIRYLFAKYPVPHFLEDVMVRGEDGDHRGNVRSDITFTKYWRWYMAVAQGQSLYKTCTHHVLTKRETHLLLQAPNDLNVVQAVWWAKTMAISNDIGIAYRMATSLITVRGSYDDAFWIDVHRFFTNNPVPMREMEELFDYIMSEHRENENWTIKKRSLESIRRHSEIWHRAQVKAKRIGGGSWNGMNVPTWTHITGKPHMDPSKSTEKRWTVRQIVTGDDLVREGQKMHHCVGSYKSACMGGQTAIFSMTCQNLFKEDQRSLTIEVNIGSKQIVQARGYANRSPRPQEKEILDLWARSVGVKEYRSRWY